ncbi:hypothetical protein V501_02895 [Pseudogymnoascus sp. VKM F-4519 (FW-2642)]|nr:hypothetical protein V501_02895 [Pseudogymnoascus sp. VKM F-4519 (FW-2642)]
MDLRCNKGASPRPGIVDGFDANIPDVVSSIPETPYCVPIPATVTLGAYFEDTTFSSVLKPGFILPTRNTYGFFQG